jgi:hypothetical protein
MPESFHGPIIGVEYQPDPCERGRFAAYTRHDDAPDFKPAQFVGSYCAKASARRVARELGRIHSVPVNYRAF